MGMNRARAFFFFHVLLCTGDNPKKIKGGGKIHDEAITKLNTFFFRIVKNQ